MAPQQSAAAQHTPVSDFSIFVEKYRQLINYFTGILDTLDFKDYGSTYSCSLPRVEYNLCNEYRSTIVKIIHSPSSIYTSTRFDTASRWAEGEARSGIDTILDNDPMKGRKGAVVQFIKHFVYELLAEATEMERYVDATPEKTVFTELMWDLDVLLRRIQVPWQLLNFDKVQERKAWEYLMGPEAKQLTEIQHERL